MNGNEVMPTINDIPLDHSKLTSAILVSLANIQAHSSLTLMMQAKIWAKLNELDEDEEKSKLQSKASKFSNDILSGMWEDMGGDPLPFPVKNE